MIGFPVPVWADLKLSCARNFNSVLWKVHEIEDRTRLKCDDEKNNQLPFVNSSVEFITGSVIVIFLLLGWIVLRVTSTIVEASQL